MTCLDSKKADGPEMAKRYGPPGVSVPRRSLFHSRARIQRQVSDDHPSGQRVHKHTPSKDGTRWNTSRRCSRGRRWLFRRSSGQVRCFELFNNLFFIVLSKEACALLRDITVNPRRPWKALIIFFTALSEISNTSIVAARANQERSCCCRSILFRSSSEVRSESGGKSRTFRPHRPNGHPY